MLARAPLRLLLALALAALVLLVARARFQPSAALPENAPSTDFSGLRARATLARVLGDGAPHPVGSDAEAAVRDRIVDELRRLGYAPRLERSFACAPRRGTCAFVTNIVAEAPGTSTDAVLVSAHYDSVGAGAGANDDGVGVACVLEIARAFASMPKAARSVVFLLDDAEEAGLIGAYAFADDGPEMARVRAAVNIDARGSRGPSMIFEVSPGTPDIVRIIAESVPRPVTSSLFFTIYKKMPNDTDFSVWKSRAMGANFAYVSGVENYHTALDRFDNTRGDTIQHQGESAFEVARALANADVTPAPSADDGAVWFDVLALGVVRWRGAFTRPLASIALLLVLVAVALHVRGRRVALSRVLLGLGALPLAIGGAALLGFVVSRALAARGADLSMWTANAPFTMTAMWLVGIAWGTLPALLFVRAKPLGLWCGTWAPLASIGVVLAWVLPGVSHLFIVPALVAGTIGIASARVGGDGVLAVGVIVPALTLLLVCSSLALLLYDGMGLIAAPVAAAMGALLAVPFAPLVLPLSERARRRIPAALFALALASAVTTTFVAPFSATLPQRVNVVFAEDEEGARALVDPSWGRAGGPAPLAMRVALGPDAKEAPRFRWWTAPALGVDAPRSGAPLPEAIVLSTTPDRDRRHVTFRLRSARGASHLAVYVPPQAEARVTRAAGMTAPEAVRMANGWRMLHFLAVPADGIVLDLDAPQWAIEVVLLDETSGVPSSVARIVAARPREATASQLGDLMILSRHIVL